MSVYRPAGNNRHVIKISFGGIHRRYPGMKDKAASEALERRIKRLHMAVTSREPAPVELVAWAHELRDRHPRLHRKLEQDGLLTMVSTTRTRSLKELLFGEIKATAAFEERVRLYQRNGADEHQARLRAMVLHPGMYEVTSVGWLHSIASDERTPRHVLQHTQRAWAVIDGCNFVAWPDIDKEKVRRWLKERRTTSKRFGIKTSNHYLKATKAFVEWAREILGLQHVRSPLEALKPLNADTDVRRKRRSPTEEDVRRLIGAVLESSEVVGGLEPMERAMLYAFTYTMGLRAGECYSLTPKSFLLEGEEPTVTVAAKAAKSRKEQVLPLPQRLVEQLRLFLADKPAGKRVWSGTWRRDPAEMLRADLERADIPYELGGEYFDFHALRHGAITNGSRVMTVPDLMNFARHSKIETTMLYVHGANKAVKQSVERLPTFDLSVGKAASQSERRVGPDHKPDHAVGNRGQSSSSVVTRATGCARERDGSENEITLAGGEGYSAVDSSCHQRGRRGSNPQPSDRQSDALTN